MNASSASSFYENINLATSLAFLGLAVPGCFLNLLCVIVFSSRPFRKLSINILLLGLSLSNLLFTVFAIPTLGFGPLSYYIDSITPLYVVSVVYVYPLAAMCHCFSIWILIPITLERWLAVCRPFQVLTYCTRRRALQTIATLTFLSVAVNIVRYWQFSVTEDCKLKLELHANEQFRLWYETFTFLLTLYAVPLSAIILLSVNIARTLKQSSRQRSRMTRSSRSPTSSRHTTKMLFCVILMFMSCYTMSLGLNVLELIEPELFSTPLGHTLGDMNNVLVVLNAVIPFFFYYKYSLRFSRAMNALLLFCRQETVQVQDAISGIFERTSAASRSVIERRRVSQKLSIYSCRSSPGILGENLNHMEPLVQKSSPEVNHLTVL